MSGEADQVISSEGKNLPKDAQVIAAILKEMGYEYDPKVLTLLMEFHYRYVTSIAEDAKMLANHAKKKVIDSEDINLAVKMHNEQSAVGPPTRDVLIETSRVRNSQPLPVPKSSSGLRLPPDRHCLTACNYKLKPKRLSQINRNVGQMPRIQIGGGAGTTFTMTMNPKQDKN